MILESKMTAIIIPAEAESEKRVQLEPAQEADMLALAIKMCPPPAGFKLKVLLVLEELPEGERRESGD